VGYVFNPLLSRLLLLDRQLGEAVLTVLMLLTLLAGLVTAAALMHLRTLVATLLAEGPGEPSTLDSTAGDRIVNRLAPVPVLINSFPRTSLASQLMAVTGVQRAWIRFPGLPVRLWGPKSKGPLSLGTRLTRVLQR
jgi:hypothetical protein